MTIKYAIISEGSYKIEETTEEELYHNIISNFMCWEPLDKNKELFVCYDSDNFYEKDSQDYQFIIKLKNSDIDSFTDARFDNLSEEDIEYIKEMHSKIFMIYSYWTRNNILNLLKYNVLDVNAIPEIIEEFGELTSCYKNMIRREMVFIK